jgi:murein L,D-transpeptidase YcbB/YkuD
VWEAIAGAFGCDRVLLRRSNRLGARRGGADHNRRVGGVATQFGGASLAAQRDCHGQFSRFALAGIQRLQQGRKSYEFNGDSQWWVNGLEPTAQAQQLIALMRQADRKGLSAEDYDGSRWDDRLAKLKPAARQPTEADAVKFDLALTVCAMRYICDLHIGRVNPKHLDFAFDNESKKYDLPEFIKDHVVNGSDVAGALATVEPAYPDIGTRFKLCKHIWI